MGSVWKEALTEHPYIKEFIKHLGNGEQEYSEIKYPVRTIGCYKNQDGQLESDGIILKGEEKEYIMLADGRRSIKEISAYTGESVEAVKRIYSKLNDRCLVYFSEF